ncbi:phage major capsid protein [Achromobacter xylosoxidans]|uniref:Phage major capsid protein n=1 Tax=Alcaligenes xylosoxydans xylosoxydans TaxID=85698 RepID=A0A424W591_ALCXX|nr:phage major capsid protein [Achromobacter xylosoxidans]MBC9904768.1 phage major capsid protein [Achromobacter xylosoxidans]MBD0868685.1 phage major capsid protein [Achromobacter xylosoxidans]QNP87812.1 phage major capsid protein [Achromobacter xylosoxidans]RPJ88415.1 phage major capsid protein [Achromobacter xylosoxidans]
MPTFANLSDIIATTIQSRSGVLADSVTNNNALLYKLRQRGNVKPVSGGNVILQELMYNDPNTQNAGSYSGYDVIDITPNSPISSAQYDLKQYAAVVTISGLEQLQNSGKEQIIDLLEGRIQVAEAQLMNQISAGIYSDGTGNGGKNITGLQAAITTSPATGTYGGINRATWSFWRNVAFSAVTNGGAAVTSANIQSYMNRVAVQLVRGTDRPDMIVADNNYYRAFLESLQAIQRVTSEDSAAAGFTSIKYMGAGLNCDVFLDGGIGGAIPTNTMYFLNTKYIFFRPHRDRNFVPIGGDRQSVNQDALVRLIGWAGNLTTSGAQFQGVLTA